MFEREPDLMYTMSWKARLVEMHNEQFNEQSNVLIKHASNAIQNACQLTLEWLSINKCS